MSCATAREALLTADRNDLRGQGDTELARHLRGCADCRAAAGRILAAEAGLGRYLAAAVPQRPLAVVLAEVEHAAARRRRRRRWMGRILAAGAAAALGIVLLRPAGDVPRRPAPVIATAPTVEVVGPPGRSVAVMETANPDIVIIWFYPPGELP